MKDLNHENIPFLFKFEVKDSYKDGGPRIHRTIEVIAETYDRAREVYYEQCGSYECEFVDLIDVSIAKSEDYDRAQYDKLLIDRNFKKKA